MFNYFQKNKYCTFSMLSRPAPCAHGSTCVRYVAEFSNDRLIEYGEYGNCLAFRPDIKLAGRKTDI